MTPDEYDKLLRDIRYKERLLKNAVDTVTTLERDLAETLNRLHREEARIARTAFPQIQPSGATLSTAGSD